ncbi:MAG: UDP-N-acetylmuramate dehydrogenase [Sedimentisphaerales bacterium]|nr:UDP-N-acetylmuramate dehydrogenase [Sedimentisphaerales bacterium]
MSIFAGLDNITKKDCLLSDYTWYRLGGKADWLVSPTTIEQLQTVLKRCHENNLPVHILGNGSNLLISDEGVRGVVIRPCGDGFNQYRFDGMNLAAGGAADLQRVLQDAVKRGLGGLEALAGIPGTIGGAVKMNAGGRFGDIGTCVQSVLAMDLHGNVFEKIKPELVFDYRHVNITARVILEARMELSEGDPEELLKTVKEVWIYKKNTQPLDMRNAGCVFKNPRGMSAGALIDRAGLKGEKIGGALVSSKHANFITTEKGCTSADVKALIEKIRNVVRDQYDVDLELEIEVW